MKLLGVLGSDLPSDSNNVCLHVDLSRASLLQHGAHGSVQPARGASRARESPISVAMTTK